MEQRSTTDLSELIAENFGANATYVEGLLGRFRSNPESVDESWRAYFTELLRGDGASASENGRNASAPQVANETSAKDSAKADAPPKADASATATAAIDPAVERVSTTPVPSAESHTEVVAIRGAALKIVENMEASLSVPTATSQRRIPVKLLDEHRRIINKYLAENDRGKASYTHLIAWAIVRALEKYPQLNDAYEVVDGKPARLRRESVNLGVAIDLEKKDGTRSLLVPNIK
ncbi:MAG TPA: 2-oxo acid dehydrogenase subunit E2, partial [Pyrinomonadaceae bacterium]|nr:2-oxo acid dehydrogenase subunit E2 [Pyrinomonadaceae bacterium]